MPSTLNEVLIRIAGQEAIPNELDLGEGITLKVVATVITKKQKDNQNGSYDLVITVKPTSIQVE